jgi:hypothetical protein
MILPWNNKERLCRVLLDWGSSIPVLNVTWATRNKVPTIEREKPLQIESLTGKTETDTGKTYTYPMRLQHRKHFLVESFYITPLEPDGDVILPFWWIAKHPSQSPMDCLRISGFPVKIVRKRKQINSASNTIPRFSITPKHSLSDHSQRLSPMTTH